jgi:hypothetical protein
MAPARESGLDGADRLACAGGDLLHRQIRQVMQEHGFPLVVRQRPQRTVEVGMLRGDIGEVSRRRRWIVFHQSIGHPPTTPSPSGDVEGDGAQPGFLVGHRCQRPPLRIRGSESLLDDFLCLGQVDLRAGQHDQGQVPVRRLVQDLEPPCLTRHAQLPRLWCPDTAVMP